MNEQNSGKKEIMLTGKMTREEERKRLQGVGSVKRDATIWEDYLTELGVEFEMVAPKRNITKNAFGYPR